MKQLLRYAVATVVLGAMALPVWADDSAQQKAPAADNAWVKQTVQTCSACHGPKGVSQVPMYPVLAGQYANYLYHSLRAYRDGDRKNPIMGGMAAGKTDAQLKALALYFSEQQSPLHTPTE